MVQLVQNRYLVIRFFDLILNDNALTHLEEFVASGYREHSYAPQQITGVERLRKRLSMLRNAFPDLSFTLSDLIVEGEMAAARWHFEGTHLGTFLGYAPTTRKVHSSGIDIYRIQQDKIVECWHQFDVLSLIGQSLSSSSAA